LPLKGTCLLIRTIHQSQIISVRWKRSNSQVKKRHKQKRRPGFRNVYFFVW
jgi:hypothetical protein